MKKRLPQPHHLLRLAIGMICALLAAHSSFAEKTPMQEYVEAMQPGWNLGNSLDASPTETSWGNAPATQELIEQVAAQGFKSIRIPVTWNQYVGPAPDYTIDPAWMDRVQEVVDWSIEADLYVMLNMHHDSIWMRDMPADHDAVLERFNAIWSQIAPRFRDYSNKLHFESINEPEFHDADDATQIALLDELNISFFDIVRGTGGNNATRPLVLPTLRTNNSQQYLDALKDTIEYLDDPNLIATVHEYGYWPFAVNITGVTKFDGAAKDWTMSGLERVNDTLVANGIPVIVGEIGLLDFSRVDEGVQRGQALQYFEHVLSYLQSTGMTYQWWDAGGFFNRSTFDWITPELYDYMLACAQGRSSTGATDLVFVDGEAPADVEIPLNLNGNSFVSITDNGSPLTEGVDYTLDGDVLTLKTSFLEQYASGEYGVKTVLETNFSSGLPWKLFVRNLGKMVLAPATTTKGLDLVIPTDFGGDVLEAMEAKYVGVAWPNPGPADWTSFQRYKENYLPNYAGKAMTIKNTFFQSTNNDPIDLIFHMWSGRVVKYRVTFTAGTVDGDADEWVVYDDSLVGWNDWASWAPRDLASTTTVQSGTNSIEVNAGAWGGVVLGHNPWETPVDTSTFKTLNFWIHGGSEGGQNIGVNVGHPNPEDSNGVIWGSATTVRPEAGTWTKVEIPLSIFGAEGWSDINRLSFQNFRGETAPTYYIDDIKFTSSLASNVTFIDGAQLSPNTLSVDRGGFALNRRARTYAQRVTVTNTGTEDVFGPIYLALDELSSNTSLANADGTTLESAPIDSPYILLTDGTIEPGASINAVLQFSMPRSGGITYTTRTIVGGENP
ncbi:cellulase family glycosylhydrolase [Pelagicoccus sp. SDUM812003]|uniref:cellulase family glycosylhydrolase n=1 Tax=Pelagicoccus sp. SDUM812003 TaxID=3041267 RepID=UPI00280CF872|nr:cellulase family glycosylhydrolase [Pelagicoccus sp. SDUM812003]MDQ8202188.1 cellulase family glycosylhydrolase [Pelagicoccus sp. SDUM812003]